jgi:LmbE family N-acetylglucosaminyl deacetylase
MQVVEKYQPDTIVTFPPKGITGHNDHKAVSRWARLLAERYAAKKIKVIYAVDSANQYEGYLKEADEKLNIYFNIDKPDLYQRAESDIALTLTEDIVTTKCNALKAMPSQYAVWLEEFSLDYIYKAFAEEFYVYAGNEHKS